MADSALNFYRVKHLTAITRSVFFAQQLSPSAKFISLANFQTFSAANSLDWSLLLFTESGNSGPNVGLAEKSQIAKSMSADVSADASCWWCVCARGALAFISTHSKQPTSTHTRRSVCECPPRRRWRRDTLAAVILNGAAARGKSAFGYEICSIYNIRECKTAAREYHADVSRMGGNAPVARPSNPASHPRATRHFYSTCAASRLRPSPRQKCQLQILFGFPAAKKTH